MYYKRYIVNENIQFVKIKYIFNKESIEVSMGMFQFFSREILSEILVMNNRWFFFSNFGRLFTRSTRNLGLFRFKPHGAFLVSVRPKYFNKFGFSSAAVATSWYGNVPEEDVENNLAHLMILAKVALENGDIERAEALLHVGLDLAETHQLPNGISFIYDILAMIAIGQGNNEKAEILLVEGIEKLTKLGYPDNNHSIIDFRLKLARMYSMSGYNTLAEIGFKNCLEQQKTKIIDGDLSDKTGLLYVHILFWYGIHKIRNEEYTTAKKLISNAYEYSTKIKGLSPKQEMVILYTLADVNMELGDYEVALSSMLDAVILGKGIGSIELPMCYLKLGHIYQKLDMADKARYSFEEARSQGQLYGYGEIVTEAITSLAALKDKAKDR